jgi:uncharacterized protein YjbI with pentapeptide repeats
LGDDPGVTARSNRPNAPTPRPLSNWTIAVGALVVLAVVAVIWFVLLRRYGGERAQIQLDAIRTAGTLVIGTGGAVALLLTARRQRYTELTLVHTDHDATERRITELYTKAADQLGSDQAPVRLAGLYALERLAHSTAEHRQTIVNVICAYLRMPYTSPPPHLARTLRRSYRGPGPARRRRAQTLTDRSPHAAPTSWRSRHEKTQQELEVRLTAQTILSRNLCVVAQHRRHRWHPKPAPTWPGIHLDLTGALLFNFALSRCQLDYADFTRAQFVGGTDFQGALFTNGVNFGDAKFTGEVNFKLVCFTRRSDFARARFANRVDFEGAEFTGEAFFRDAQFTGGANFEFVSFTRRGDFKDAQFIKEANFEDAWFTSTADFTRAQFADRPNFEDTRFTGWTFFKHTQFMDGVSFKNTQLMPWAWFEDAWVASAAKRSSVWPPGWTTRPAQPDNGEDPAFLYLTKVEEGNPSGT